MKSTSISMGKMNSQLCAASRTTSTLVKGEYKVSLEKASHIYWLEADGLRHSEKPLADMLIHRHEILHEQ
jgi:hypothetical protein